MRDVSVKRRLMAEVDEPEPFRIKVDYQLENLTPEQTTYLQVVHGAIWPILQG